MDSIYYRQSRYTPPRPPALVRVRTTSRAAVLDALEYGPLLSRADLAERVDLGDTALRHAIRQLSHEGVLTPQSSRIGATISVARYSVLPVWEITPRRMVWRLCDTLGKSVFATVRDRGKFRSIEDDFTALMGQASTILGAGTCGLPKDIPLQPAVLLCPDGVDFPSLPLLRPLMTLPTADILSTETAVAHELPYLPAMENVESLLHIHAGDDNPDVGLPQITLFTRRVAGDLQSPFVPAPTAPDFRQALSDYVGDQTPYTATWWSRLAAFLGDLCRFVRISRVILEIDRPQDHASAIRAPLPSHVKLIRVRYALNTPPLAHRGALRINRRLLWDNLEGNHFPES